MSRRNRKFVVDSMKRGFISRLQKAGIDPQMVDLEKYDWESFTTLDDLIEYYASSGDIVCKKLWERENYDESVYQYLMSHGVELSEEAIEAISKYIREQIADINIKYLNLESHINDIYAKISSLAAAMAGQGQVNTNVNISMDKMLEELKNELQNIKIKIHSIQDAISNPKCQTTLTFFEANPKTNSEANVEANVEDLIEPLIEPRENKREKNNKKGFNFWRFALVNVIGFILSLIASDILHVSMLMFYLIFMAMAFLDGLIWGAAWGRGNGKTARAFATGYMYSQYTNPYKIAKG